MIDGSIDRLIDRQIDRQIDGMIERQIDWDRQDHWTDKKTSEKKDDM